MDGKFEGNSEGCELGTLEGRVVGDIVGDSVGDAVGKKSKSYLNSPSNIAVFKRPLHPLLFPAPTSTTTSSFP